MCFPCFRSRLKFGLARRVRPFRYALAFSFSTFRPDMVHTHGISPNFRDCDTLPSQVPVRKMEHESTAEIHSLLFDSSN